MPSIIKDSDGNEEIERGEDRTPDGAERRESWRGPEVGTPMSREDMERGRAWYDKQFRQTNISESIESPFNDKSKSTPAPVIRAPKRKPETDNKAPVWN